MDPTTIGVAGHVDRGMPGLRKRNTPGSDPDDESDFGMPFMEQVPIAADEVKFSRVLVGVSAFDVLVGSPIIFITAWTYAYRDSGASLLSLGLQAMSHWMSSILLLFRMVIELRSQTDEPGLLLGRRRAQLFREQLLSVIVGLLLLTSSCVVLYKSINKLQHWDRWYDHTDRQRMDKEAELVTEWLAWVGFTIYVIQAFIRVVVAVKVRFPVVSHGAVISLLSLLYLFVLGFAASYEREWSWKAEPVAGIFLAILTLIEGVRIVFSYLDDMDTRLRSANRA